MNFQTMAENLVLFNIRFEKNLVTLFTEAPTNFTAFTKKLKDKLGLDDKEILLLYPTPDGKMHSISNNIDIESLKNTKLCYNVKSKQLYCSVELMVIIIHGMQQNDPITIIKGLTKKVDRLSTKLDEYLLCFDNKLKENTSNILESIRSITLSEQSMENSGNASIKNSIGEMNIPNASVGKGHMKPQQKVKKDDEKILMTSNDTPATNDDLPNAVVNNSPQDIPECSSNTTTKPHKTDVLLKMLVDEGFTNVIQNIIVLKRFDNDIEKAANYLKSQSQ